MMWGAIASVRLERSQWGQQCDTHVRRYVSDLRLVTTRCSVGTVLLSITLVLFSVEYTL